MSNLQSIHNLKSKNDLKIINVFTMLVKFEETFRKINRFPIIINNLDFYCN